MKPERMGFFTDTTVCIGCKACEVACKQWNRLQPAAGGAPPMRGDSYDNTGRLDGFHWRHVKFIEQAGKGRGDLRWLMMSDCCKHCVEAPCLAACPEQAIIRTEFDTVLILPDRCKGHWDCSRACPFNVIKADPKIRIARKCTFCYDRLREGLPPACAKACPTKSSASFDALLPYATAAKTPST